MEFLRKRGRCGSRGRLHSIPEPPHREGLVTSEPQCRPWETEAHMETGQKTSSRQLRLIDHWRFFVVLLLSVVHIGVAYTEVRDSGGAYLNLA